MQAVQYTRYGPPAVLELVEIPAPAVGEGQVLVRAMASSVNAVDWHLMRGRPTILRVQLGLRRPRRSGIGADIAGVVEAAGRGVSTFSPGDEVFGTSTGAWAELVVVSAEGLVAKPDTVSWEDAGVTGVAALTALQGVRDIGRVAAGQRVLVAGAGGGVGHFALQIALELGARVTASTTATAIPMVRGLGAHEVVDYGQVDPTREAGRYDVIVDAGGRLSFRQLTSGLRRGGIAVLAGAGERPDLPRVARRLLTARVLSLGSRRYVSYRAGRTPEDLRFLAALLESRALRPVIDRRFTLESIREAVAFQETERARGKVGLSIGGGRALVIAARGSAL